MNRKERHRPHERTLPFGIATDWTPQQAYAVVELLDELRELIYAHYLGRIQEHLRDERQCHTPHQRDDDPPF